MFRTIRRRLATENLEARVLMHGGHGKIDFDSLDSTPCAGAGDDVPALHSLPGAAAKIFLDFNGHYEDKWGNKDHVDIVGFDLEGGCSTMSQRELDVINDVWRAVSEDFAPFNIDVTTSQPDSFEDGEALRVVIGGNAWENSTLGETTSGVAKRNSFTDPDVSNVAYVFSKNIEERGGYSDDKGLAAMIATTVSHEAGHSFGLNHQSAYDASGTQTAEYNTGTNTWTPIMGANRSTDRTTWHNGATTSASTFQDDMAILAGDKNGFGYRPDEAGDTVGSAAGFGVSYIDTDLKVTGVISTTSDIDLYRFTTDGGQTTINLDVIEFANLDARMQLMTITGGVLQTITLSDPEIALNAWITADLAAGEYFVAVASDGDYGDVGYYRITVDLGNDGSAEVSPADWADKLQWANELLYQRQPATPTRPGPVPDPVPYEMAIKEQVTGPATKEMATKQDSLATPTRAVTSSPNDRAVDQIMDQWDARGDDLAYAATSPQGRGGGR